MPEIKKIAPKNAVKTAKKAQNTPIQSKYPVKQPLKSSEETSSFRQLIQLWLEDCRKNGLSGKTILDYQDKVFKFCWWWTDYTNYAKLLGYHPKNVTSEHAKEYASYLRTPQNSRWGIVVPEAKRQLSQASIDTYGRTVKVFFAWLEREGKIARSPFNRSVKFSNLRSKEQKVKTLSQSEISKIFDLLTNPRRMSTFIGARDLAMISLLLDSGIRLGELLSIKQSDLDLKNNSCKVMGKTGQRTAVFSQRCKEFLKAYQRHTTHPYNTGKAKPSNNDPFWFTSDGLPLSYSGCQSVVARLKKETGIAFHLHQFRHSFASSLAQQGVNAFELKDLLGHASITTTQIYVRNTIEHLAAVQKAKSPLSALNLKNVKRGRGRPRKYQN